MYWTPDTQNPLLVRTDRLIGRRPPPSSPRSVCCLKASRFQDKVLRDPEQRPHADVLVDIGPMDDRAQAFNRPMLALRTRRSMKAGRDRRGGAQLATIGQMKRQPIGVDPRSAAPTPGSRSPLGDYTPQFERSRRAEARSCTPRRPRSRARGAARCNRPSAADRCGRAGERGRVAREWRSNRAGCRPPPA